MDKEEIIKGLEFIINKAYILINTDNGLRSDIIKDAFKLDKKAKEILKSLEQPKELKRSIRGNILVNQDDTDNFDACNENKTHKI